MNENQQKLSKDEIEGDRFIISSLKERFPKFISTNVAYLVFE